MTFPDSVQTVTLTVGPLLDASGSPMERVPLTVILGTQVLIAEGGAALPSRVRRITGATGTAQATVVATDSTGISVTGFRYTVHCPGVTTDGPILVALPAAVPEVAVESLVAVAASDGETVNLPLITADAAIAGLVADSDSDTRAALEALGGGGGAVSSVNGETGAVSLSAADVGAAPALGSDDNYVTDAEKAALHTHPAVIAQGATQADARAAIGAGTSSFSGAYADLTDAPAIPDSPNDIGAAAALHSHAPSDVTGTALVAALADAKGDLLVATAADTVSRLAVGTDGQVLTADSAQTSGVKWAAAAGGGVSFQPHKVGRWHLPDYPLKAWDSGGSMTAGMLYCARMVITGTETYDAWGISVTTAGAAGKVIRAMLYALDGDTLYPAALVADMGTVSCATTGDKQATLGAAVTLAPGVYARCIVTDDTGGTVRVRKTSGGTDYDGTHRAYFGHGQGGIGDISTMYTVLTFTGYVAGDAAPNPATTAGASGLLADFPLTWMRRSA